MVALSSVCAPPATYQRKGVHCWCTRAQHCALATATCLRERTSLLSRTCHLFVSLCFLVSGGFNLFLFMKIFWLLYACLEIHRIFKKKKMVYSWRRTTTTILTCIECIECAHAFALAPPSVYACPSATMARPSQATPEGLGYQPTFGRLRCFFHTRQHTRHIKLYMHLSYCKHFPPSHTQHLGMGYKGHVLWLLFTIFICCI